MARTVKEIEEGIILGIKSDTRLSEINTDSKVAIWRLWVSVFAFSAWALESLFDIHLTEVSTIIAEQKPHRPRWYKNKALAFQNGFDLVTDSDVYDNTGYTDDQVDQSKIIKYCAVVESQTESRLIIKIATEQGGILQPATPGQRNAFTAYMAEIKDAGVGISIINYLPDHLYLTIQIYYDPLVLDAQGNSIISGGKPVETAILEYMGELDFNGELVLAYLVDKLQKVPGVAIPNLMHAETNWIDAQSNDYGATQPINVKRIPEAGYFTIVNFDNITYIANV